MLSAGALYRFQKPTTLSLVLVASRMRGRRKSPQMAVTMKRPTALSKARDAANTPSPQPFEPSGRAVTCESREGGTGRRVGAGWVGWVGWVG